MSYEHFLFEKQNRIAAITINRPPMNVLHIPAISELNQILDEVIKDNAIHFVLFKGAGEKAFSAGVDIKDHTLDKVESMIKSFHQIFRTLYRSSKLSVASVHGYCLGGGMELATFCDIVIAADNAVFGQPEIKVGCYPPVAAALLPRLIGAKRSFEIAMLGETFSAQHALTMGLVNQVVPYDQLQKTTDEWIAKLSKMSGSVLHHTKRALLAGIEQSFEAALDKAENIYLNDLIRTDDLTEGVQAFMEKRNPSWKHR
ncbi:enoyl-CoA hydratase/isomerase family protein [bacterium]|nr:enoyl-CoA hydratase/isomerase family protein [bacterium]